MWTGIIDHYKNFISLDPQTKTVSLGEGNTPLVRAPRLSAKVGLRVYLKIEGSNPTGSFKDRGMTVAVSQALNSEARAILCASTGNTSASAAAYGARAGLPCFVLLPEGAVALGKLSQAIVYNAKVIPIKGNFDQALTLVREIAQRVPVAIVNSINPYRIEGQKTGAFEICDQLESAPDFHLIPVGNAGNITAYWKGYQEYLSAQRINKLPRMLGFQAAGAAPIVRGEAVQNPQTFATAIRIGNPASWQGALQARDKSRGLIESVTDEEIMLAYHYLAEKEGVFAEPASAAGVAGLLKMADQGYFRQNGSKESVAVCVLTGSGLKDPDAAIHGMSRLKAVDCKANDIIKEMGL